MSQETTLDELWDEEIDKAFEAANAGLEVDENLYAMLKSAYKAGFMAAKGFFTEQETD